MTYAVELVRVSKAFGSFVAVDDVSLQIRDGEFFSLLGPSGCGKTTTLRLIAGFDMPTSGEIRIQGEPVGDLPAYKRPVNTVFQNYALFPHMTVTQNIAFGLEMQKAPRAEIKTRVAEALDMVRMSDFADRRPHQLSGGQQQRIALARALVNQPSVLLLDEPLGALDLKLRKAMQLELKQVQQEVGITFIYVTHDQEEALTMSDRIAVMSHGAVIQCATPREIYERPMTRYVADFIGETNFLHGQIVSQNGVAEVLIDGQTPILAAASEHNLPPGEKVTVAIRPEKINIAADGHGVNGHSGSGNGHGSGPVDAAALNADGRTCVVRGTVRDSIYIGTDTRYIVQLNDTTQLVARIQNFGEGFDQRIERGAQVLAHWAADNARILLD